MGRTVLAVLGALIAWFVITLALGLAMRESWSAYAAVADAMAFSLPMMLARLALGVIATMAAGYIAARFAEHRRAAPIAVGVILFALFLPQHLQLWDKFLWYHAFFLLSLVPLAIVGGRLAQRPATHAGNALRI